MLPQKEIHLKMNQLFFTVTTKKCLQMAINQWTSVKHFPLLFPEQIEFLDCKNK